MLRAFSSSPDLHLIFRALRYCSQTVRTSRKYASKPEKKWRNEIKARVRKASQADISSEDQQVFAGIILERYPICFPDPDPSTLDFDNWSKKWNSWKYKVDKKGWLDCEKPVTDDGEVWPRLSPCTEHHCCGYSRAGACHSGTNLVDHIAFDKVWLVQGR